MTNQVKTLSRGVLSNKTGVNAETIRYPVLTVSGLSQFCGMTVSFSKADIPVEQIIPGYG